MRALIVAAFALTSLTCWCAIASQPLSDAHIEKLIVGKWKNEQSESDAFTEYRDDGTFIADGYVERIEGQVKIRVSGSWFVRDGIVVEVVEKCEPPAIQRGITLHDAVIELNAKTFCYRTERGIVRMKTRD